MVYVRCSGVTLDGRKEKNEGGKWDQRGRSEENGVSNRKYLCSSSGNKERQFRAEARDFHNPLNI